MRSKRYPERMKLRRELCIAALAFTLLTGCGGGTQSGLHSVDSVVPSVTLAGNSIAVSGNYAYVTNFDAMKLDIVDVTNPAVPSVLSSVALSCSALPIALSGNTVYVGCYQSTRGIASMDVTNPAAPVLLGYTATTASLDVQDLLFSGGDLYALSGDPGSNFNILTTGPF
jgi:hypothetical protein